MEILFGYYSFLYHNQFTFWHCLFFNRCKQPWWNNLNFPLSNFAESFFFSCQTFTTVGYGRISPVSFTASAIAALEALLGLLSLALATGLLYGRFSKPVAHLRFSENALIAPFKDINALMLRVAPFKNTNLIDVEAKLTLGLIVEENGKKVNNFYQLELEYKTINSLSLSWTIVHPITEKSPLYGFTKEDFENTKGELIVFVKAFDDLFSNIVVAISSYTFSEVKHGQSLCLCMKEHKVVIKRLYILTN